MIVYVYVLAQQQQQQLRIVLMKLNDKENGDDRHDDDRA